MSLGLPRLYAILDVDLSRARGWAPLDLLDLWLEAGVGLVQLRAKSLTFGPMLELADEVVARTHVHRGIAVVNDRVDVARLSGADGVHLGQTDLSPAEARGILGADRLIGLSTHSAVQVAAAGAEPIDYLAIGPVFRTTSKQNPDDVVGLDGVRVASTGSGGRPVVAIGGITIERAADVFAAGATAVAVISDLLEGDPRERIREWLGAL